MPHIIFEKKVWEQSEIDDERDKKQVINTKHEVVLWLLNREKKHFPKLDFSCRLRHTSFFLIICLLCDSRTVKIGSVFSFFLLLLLLIFEEKENQLFYWNSIWAKAPIYVWRWTIRFFHFIFGVFPCKYWCWITIVSFSLYKFISMSSHFDICLLATRCDSIIHFLFHLNNCECNVRCFLDGLASFYKCACRHESVDRYSEKKNIIVKMISKKNWLKAYKRACPFGNVNAIRSKIVYFGFTRARCECRTHWKRKLGWLNGCFVDIKNKQNPFPFGSIRYTKATCVCMNLFSCIQLFIVASTISTINKDRKNMNFLVDH